MCLTSFNIPSVERSDYKRHTFMLHVIFKYETKMYYNLSVRTKCKSTSSFLPPSKYDHHHLSLSISYPMSYVYPWVGKCYTCEQFYPTQHTRSIAYFFQHLRKNIIKYTKTVPALRWDIADTTNNYN